MTNFKPRNADWSFDDRYLPSFEADEMLVHIIWIYLTGMGNQNLRYLVYYSSVFNVFSQYPIVTNVEYNKKRNKFEPKSLNPII